MKENFTYSTTGEPHAIRRAEMLRKYPEIRKLFGTDPTPVFITIAVIILQLVLASLMAKQSWWVIVLSAYFVGSILNHWLAMTVHETSHNLVLKTPLQNKILAMVANFPYLFPMAMTFHRYHVAHHIYLGVDSLDTDLPLPREVKIIKNSRILKFLWLSFYLIVYSVRGLFFISPPNKWEIINIIVQIPVVALIWYFLGNVAIAYLALSTFFGMSLHPVAAHFIHEHYTFKEGQETYSYYGPLNHVTFNVGYHYEHHDFMNIPGSKLPALKKMAPEYYDNLLSHNSWTQVLWNFIMNRKISLASRIVRTHEDFEKGRRELKKANHA